MSIELDGWLEVVQREYLDTYIAQGGAAVRIVVSETQRRETIQALIERAENADYVVAGIDAGSTRVDRIDQVFCAVARRIDWIALAQAVRTRALLECGYAVVDGDGNALDSFEAIATENNVARMFVQQNFQEWLTAHVFRDHGMSHEFRVAMLQLCSEPLRSFTPGNGSLADNIVAWLRGELRLISALKPTPIYQKVARHNARDLFVSLGRWLDIAGKNGLFVIVDASGVYLHPKGAAVEAGQSYYTRPAVMDFYEVLRQFIDATDEMHGICLATVVPPDFNADDTNRGVNIYRALQMRVAEEVQGRQHDNPVASLVRIEVMS